MISTSPLLLYIASYKFSPSVRLHCHLLAWTSHHQAIRRIVAVQPFAEPSPSLAPIPSSLFTRLSRSPKREEEERQPDVS